MADTISGSPSPPPPPLSVPASSATTTMATAGPPIKKRGRKPAQFWVSFTTQDEPYKSRSATCRHCLATVSYHKKWEQAKSHLMKCDPFLQQMQLLESYDRPVWFAVEVEKRRRSTARLLPIDLLRGDGSTSDSGSAAAIGTKAASGSRKPTKTRGSLGAVATSELLVLQALRSGGAVDTQMLTHVLGLEGAVSAQAIVDRMYDRVSQRVNTVLESSSGGFTVLMVRWEETASAVEYFVAVHSKCFFIEQNSIPTTITDDDNTAVRNDWLVQDICRVVGAIGVSVHRLVLDASRDVLQNMPAIQIEEQNETRTLPVRQRPRRTLVDVVEYLFVESSEDPANPLEGVVEVALQCRDICRLLDLCHAQPQDVHSRVKSRRNLVQGIRRISVGNACTAIVQADSLLDAETLRSHLDRSSLQESTKLAVSDIVSKAAFAIKLRRYRAVIQPLADAWKILNKPVVTPSDAVVAIRSIRSHYQADEMFSDPQKQFLSSALARLDDVCAHEDFLIAHLLDPAYAGDLFDDATKVTGEQHLLSAEPSHASSDSVPADDDIKQALFIEYTQFQLAAMQLRTTADGFVHRMLKERKKTVLEYWLTDGRRCPRLQSIVVKIEQSPADMTLAEAMDDQLMGLVDGDKAHYIRRNAPQWSVSELLHAGADSAALDNAEQNATLAVGVPLSEDIEI